MKVTLVSIPVQDPIEAHEIYTSMLGFTSKEFNEEANLPIMVFSAESVDEEMMRLKEAGVRVRPDLDKPEWGLRNMFEDGCGNLLMLQEAIA